MSLNRLEGEEKLLKDIHSLIDIKNNRNYSNAQYSIIRKKDFAMTQAKKKASFLLKKHRTTI
jgi:hypothetical protein